jgi:E3 ubiquitin-protein ligase RNF115/126
MPMNPLMGLFAAMSGGQHGDFVYSQEALDRIISQLMEQTATSNAPGPAPQEAIDSLPKKTITAEMLGAEGRAECSICMDEVNIGEEVTELPCKHWFHHPCVAAWLTEHDTCPHCRKGIAKPRENAGNPAAGGDATSSRADPTSSMPGAFGNSNNPFIVPGAFPPSANTETNSSNTQTQGDVLEDSNGGGIGERFRRGWSGPPH